MNHQEWFEKFKIWSGLDIDEFCDPAQLSEEWKNTEVALIRMAVELLPSFAKRTIKLIFFSGLTEREVAKRMRIAKTTVHRIKKNALMLLSKAIFVKFVLSKQLLRQGKVF